MNPQDFLRNAANNIIRRNQGQLKKEIQEVSRYNPLIALENTAYKQLENNPVFQLNQQTIKESLLPSQAEEAARSYLRELVNTAIQNSQKNNTPIEVAIQETLKTTSPKQYSGNAPQGTGALTQVIQEINNPVFQSLIDPESPLGLSQIEALKYLY